tara:strand:- start:83 stop:268 length:186 start_codon:yes stop_codon:yes gene_type:complete
MKLQKNNFVVTFKTQEEIAKYFDSHISSEKSLLWLGFFIAINHISHKLEADGLEITKKPKK